MKFDRKENSRQKFEDIFMIVKGFSPFEMCNNAIRALFFVDWRAPYLNYLSNMYWR